MGKIRFKAVSPEPPWTPFQEAPGGPLGGVLYVNSRYHVIVRVNESPLGDITHLSIRRNDRAPLKDWRDFQRIKNELVGPGREAVELYPSESRCVDSANQYHLWVLPEGKFFPFGYFERLVTVETTSSTSTSRQRPFEKTPTGVVSQEELARRVKAEEERLKQRLPEELSRRMAIAVGSFDPDPLTLDVLVRLP